MQSEEISGETRRNAGSLPRNPLSSQKSLVCPGWVVLPQALKQGTCVSRAKPFVVRNCSAGALELANSFGPAVPHPLQEGEHVGEWVQELEQVLLGAASRSKTPCGPCGQNPL